MKTEWKEGIPFLLKDFEVQLRERLEVSLLDLIEGTEVADAGFEALDPKLSRAGGGYAFLWQDVLALGDAIDTVKDILSELSPNEAAKLLLKMVTLWMKLRRVRVELERKEFLVLRAIKCENTDFDSIAKYTGLSIEKVESVVQQLKNRRYKEEIPLIEESEGSLETKF